MISKNGIDKTIDAKDTQLFNSMKTNFDKTFKEYLDFIAEPNSNKKIEVARKLIIVKNKIIAALIEEKTDEAQRLIRSFSTVLNETAELWKKKVEEEEKNLLENKKRQAEKVALQERIKKQDNALSTLQETHKVIDPYLHDEEHANTISEKRLLQQMIGQLAQEKDIALRAVEASEKDAGDKVTQYENRLAELTKTFADIEARINRVQGGKEDSSVIRTPSAQVPADNRTYSFKDKKTGEWKTVDANGWKEEQERRAAEQERISHMTSEQMLVEGIERREEKSGEQAYLDFLEKDPKGFKQAFVGKKWTYGDPLKKVVTDVIKKYVDRLRTKQIDMNDRLNKHRAEAERLGEGEGGYNTLAAAGYEKKLELLGDEIDSLDENMIPQAELDLKKVQELRAEASANQSRRSVRETFQPQKGVAKLAPIPEGLSQEELRAYKAPEVPITSDNMVRSIDMNDPSDAWRKDAKDLRYIEQQGYPVVKENLEEKKQRKFTAVKNLFDTLQKSIKLDSKLPNSTKIRNRRLILGGGLAVVTGIIVGALLQDDKRSGEEVAARAPRTLEEAVPLESWRTYVTGPLASEELKTVVKDFVDEKIGFNKFAQKYFTEMHIDPNNPESLSTVAKLEPFMLMSDAPTCAGTNNDQRKQLCDYIIKLQAIGDATYGLAREKQRTAINFAPISESMGPKPRETLEEYYMRILTAAVNADLRYQASRKQQTTRI
jgi:predicted small secreted protein